MKARPILFSGPMVRALLDGSKTQTRRIAKPQPVYDGRFAEGWKLVGKKGHEAAICSPLIAELCPYGQPGDRLWVRETFAHIYRDNATPDQRRNDDVAYKADQLGLYEYAYGTWKPSIHMPRWASRITLEVTGVRVERLQDICEADALAEGVQGHPFRPDDGWPICTGYMVGPDDGKTTLHPKPQDAYQRLWEEINGPESWEANPWVWVVEFKRA